MRVAIAGATGFVGALLLKTLPGDFHVVALRRVSTADKSPSPDGITWKTCDLYSMLQIEKALEGVDTAVYLVHSMLPTARLTQSSFEDADLLLADNFARAAKRAGVKRIIYLGGIIPETSRLSRHLLSRLEVEKALSSQGVPEIGRAHV